MKIAFIGLGNMGRPMAVNLVMAGYTVAGYDPFAEALTAFTGQGGQGAESVAAAVAEADAVVTMLPAGPQARAVYLNPEGVLASAKPGTLFIDCSTIDVDSARAIAAATTKASFAIVDAPVSGGVGGATAGTLTFMVGGPAEALERARPLLEAMGKTIVHCGGAGNGQAAKICNNMVLGISMIAVSEAFALAEKLGLDAQVLFDVSSKSSGQCWSLTSYCPVPGPVPNSPANRDYAPGFTGAMMLKDLLLAQSAASGAGAATPLGSLAAQIYQLHCASGDDGLDFSAVFKMIAGR